MITLYNNRFPQFENINFPVVSRADVWTGHANVYKVIVKKEVENPNWNSMLVTFRAQIYTKFLSNWTLNRFSYFQNYVTRKYEK